MNMMTERLKEKLWTALEGELSHLNGFDNREEYDFAFSELTDYVMGDSSRSYLCRKRAGRKFDSWNLDLINVESEHDFERIVAPAIGGAPL